MRCPCWHFSRLQLTEVGTSPLYSSNSCKTVDQITSIWFTVTMHNNMVWGLCVFRGHSLHLHQSFVTTRSAPVWFRGPTHVLGTHNSRFFLGRNLSGFSAEKTSISASAVPHCWSTKRTTTNYSNCKNARVISCVIAMYLSTNIWSLLWPWPVSALRPLKGKKWPFSAGLSSLGLLVFSEESQ